MRRRIVSETSLAHLVCRASHLKKKVLWHKTGVDCVNECTEEESSGCNPRPKINYFPLLCWVSETRGPVYKRVTIKWDLERRCEEREVCFWTSLKYRDWFLCVGMSADSIWA